MWWRISETIAKANVGAMPTDEITVSQGWIMGTRNVHEHASCASGILSSAQGVLRQERSCREQRAQDMLRRKVHVERNDGGLDLGSGSDSRSGPTVLFTTTWHHPQPLGTTHSSSIHKPNSSTPKPVGESRDQELEQGHACLESAGIRPQRRGSGAGFTPYEDLPDGTKDVPLTSEVRQQTSHYLEKKAMSEQIAGLPKSFKKTWEGANEVLKLSMCKTHVCLVEKTTVEDLQKRVLMGAFGRTQEDDGQRLRAGAKGEAIEDFEKRAQLHDEAENVEHAHCEQREANTFLQEIEEKSVASRYGV